MSLDLTEIERSADCFKAPLANRVTFLVNKLHVQPAVLQAFTGNGKADAVRLDRLRGDFYRSHATPFPPRLTSRRTTEARDPGIHLRVVTYNPQAGGIEPERQRVGARVQHRHRQRLLLPSGGWWLVGNSHPRCAKPVVQIAIADVLEPHVRTRTTLIILLVDALPAGLVLPCRINNRDQVAGVDKRHDCVFSLLEPGKKAVKA